VRRIYAEDTEVFFDMKAFLRAQRFLTASKVDDNPIIPPSNFDYV
jgi:hypothetical protein